MKKRFLAIILILLMSVSFVSAKETYRSDAEVATGNAAAIHAGTAKTTPVDADEIGIIDSAASYVYKVLTWANLKATLLSYFDTQYPNIAGESESKGAIITGTGSGWVVTTVGTNGYRPEADSTATGGWKWSEDTGGGTTLTIKENDSAVGDADIATLDFLGADFTVAESPDTEIQIGLDYTNAQKATNAQPGFATAAQITALESSAAFVSVDTEVELRALTTTEVTASVSRIIQYGYWAYGDNGGGEWSILSGTAVSNGLADDGCFTIENDDADLTFVRICIPKILDARQAGVRTGSGVSAAIAEQNAIAFERLVDALYALGGGTVLVPGGISEVDDSVTHTYTGACIELQPGVKLIGIKPENGWALYPEASMTQTGSVIKLYAGTNKPVIGLTSGRGQGVHNLVIDGNRDNNTSKGNHGIYGRASGGFTISGIRVEEVTGWAFYSYGCRPGEVINSSFRSGIFLEDAADVLIKGNQIDGNSPRNGTWCDHPAVLTFNATCAHVDSNIIFGPYKAVVSTTFTSDYTDNTITVADSTHLYNGMPVLLTTTADDLPAGLTERQGYYLKNSSGDVWELYDGPFSDATQYEFTDDGTGTHTLTPGRSDVGVFVTSDGIQLGNNRFGGAWKSPITLIYSFNAKVTGNTMMSNNYSDTANVYGINVLGSPFAMISDNQIGDFRPDGEPTYPLNGILLDKITTSRKTHGCVIGVNTYNDSYLHGDPTGDAVFLKDTWDFSEAGFTYANRNKVTKINDWGLSGVIDSTSYYYEHFFMYHARLNASTQSLADGAITSVVWRQESSLLNPFGVSEASTAISLPWTKGSTYRIHGNLQIDGANIPDEEFRLDVFVYLPDSSNLTVYSISHVGTSTDDFTIPFDVDWFCDPTTDTENSGSVTIGVYQNNTTSTDLVLNASYTRMVIEKVQDIPYK